uniref:Uncharacterized protein n=1 Tax=Denticeps clupeoides TaxID=299321 RepID=A0AAY4AIM3_9TELE
MESMRQAELCDWALDPAIFTSLCDSLNRFFTQKGLITSASPVPAPPTQPTLHNMTHPFPLAYPSASGTGGPSIRKDTNSQHQNKAVPRQQLPHPATNQRLPDTGEQPQPVTPGGRPPMKHSNSEEIQDDFDWDSLIV